LERDWDRISGTAYAEEDSFRRTLAQGTTILDTATAKAKSQGSTKLPGQDAFTLHDTYGFPIDLTLEIAADQGLEVDQAAFKELMAAQRRRARADALAKKTGHADTAVYQSLLAGLQAPPQFTGYAEYEDRGRIVGLLAAGVAQPVVTGPAEVEVVLDRSPVYAEAGGQLADQGAIEFDSGAVMEVDDVQRPVRGLAVHRGRLIEGSIALGESGQARIDTARRKAISRAHTATHMVHKVLREELGSTATQAGSENAPSRLRFDFRYGGGVPAAAMETIEGRVNQMLAEDLEVTEDWMSLDDARAAGAMALFGEKYGDWVRVVSIGGDWSRELCGGTHVPTSGRLGRVAVLGVGSIGSGVRRVDALVGDGAYGYQAREHVLVGQLTELLKVRSEELPDRVASLVARLRDAERELGALRQARLLARAGEIAKSASGGAAAVAVFDAGADAQVEDLRALAQDVRSRLGEQRPAVVAVGGATGGRAVIVLAVNQAGRAAGLRAGALAKVASTVLGGGGGGRDDMAQGGGADPGRLPEAFAAVRQEVGA
jgi:alanyl-tRNA synthetase